MVILGIMLILVGSYLSIFIAKIDFIKSSLELVPAVVPSEFVVNSITFIIVYLFYYMFEKAKNKKIFTDIETINTELNRFLTEKEFELESSKTPLFHQNVILLNSCFKEYKTLSETTTKKIDKLEETVENLEDMVDLQTTLVCKVNESGKILKANKRFLKFLAFENEVKLNMKTKSVKELFDDDLGDNWLYELLHQEVKVSLKGVEFLLKIEKVDREQYYVLSLINITKFEEEKRELEKKTLYTNENLKSEMAINKTLEICMIRIHNYENYATTFGSGILEVFEDKFVEKLKSLGYDEIFKIQNDIFAVYDLKVDFEHYKKILEESIILSVGGDEYIFNPRIVLASGVNFNQAYQQILESSHTLVSKEKDDVKYHLEIVNVVNKALIKNKVILGYKVIENQNNTILIYPSIKDEYGSNIIDQNMVISIAREFNLYLAMMKQVLINNVNLLKNYKIIIDVKSEDLLSSTLLADLLSLITREELLIVFNVDINSKYSVVLPILKQIKSHAQLGLKHVGRGYLPFKDIYALKIEYIEIDESIINLIKANPQWKFLLDSIKLLISAQKTRLLANNYKEENIFRISNQLKVYEN